MDRMPASEASDPGSIPGEGIVEFTFELSTEEP